MTAYQVICAVREGKRIYRAEKGARTLFVWALSLENAKSKFPGWIVSEYARLTLILEGRPEDE